MFNEDNNLTNLENDDVHRLLRGLKRVEAPNDFDFRVRAKIAAGRPSEKRASWFPAIARFAVPGAALLSVGVYFGTRPGSQPEMSPAVVASVPASEPIAASTEPAGAPTAVANSERAAVQPPVEPQPTIASPVVKTERKSPATPNPKAETPAGGSYEIAGTGQTTISKPDVDDLEPPKKVLVSAKDFLSGAGIAASSTGAGGRIISVGGKAAAAGVKIGDVIRSVNPQTGVVTVTRDGQSMTFVLR